MCPEEFDFVAGRRGAELHYVEAGVDADRVEGDFPWDALDERKALIFCSLGSVADSRRFYQDVIDGAAREPGWQLVMSIGSSLSAADFQRVPPDAILVQWAPQLGLLARASLMITHGGFGSVKECIHFGVPQVVFPLGFDQPGNAMRVQHHGLGLVGSFAQSSPEHVHALLARVLGDERYRARSRSMSQIFRSKQEQRAGALLIERFLETSAAAANARSVNWTPPLV